MNHESKTSMERLYAVGETACNGVHGKNRLASNSLLESMVFAKRAAQDIVADEKQGNDAEDENQVALRKNLLEGVDLQAYQDDSSITETYRRIVREAIQKADESSSDFKDEEEYRRIQERKQQIIAK